MQSDEGLLVWKKKLKIKFTITHIFREGDVSAYKLTKL